MSHKSFLDANKRETEQCVTITERESEGGTDRVTWPVKIYGSGVLTIAGMWAL